MYSKVTSCQGRCTWWIQRRRFINTIQRSLMVEKELKLLCLYGMQFCRCYLLNSCYCINGKLRIKLAKSSFSTFQHKIWCCLHWLLRFASWFSLFFCLRIWKKCVVHPPIFKSLNLDFYSTKFIEVKIICEHIFHRLWWKGRGKCNSVFCWLDTKNIHGKEKSR